MISSKCKTGFSQTGSQFDETDANCKYVKNFLIIFLGPNRQKIGSIHQTFIRNYEKIFELNLESVSISPKNFDPYSKS